MIINTVSDSITQTSASAWNTFTDGVSNTGNWTISSLSSLKDGALSVVNSILEWAKPYFSDFLNFLSSAKSALGTLVNENREVAAVVGAGTVIAGLLAYAFNRKGAEETTPENTTPENTTPEEVTV